MYLSQLAVNLQSRAARGDLADRYELHRTLAQAFPKQFPEEERVLFRVEMQRNQPYAMILVQSQTRPAWNRVERLGQGSYLRQEPAVRLISPALSRGTISRFRLQANPTIKREGKRLALYAEDALIQWLIRKANLHGFAIDSLDIRVTKLGKVFGKNRHQTWHAVQFDGVLTVTDVERFEQTLGSGIGSAKAFGFGLLSVPYK